MTMQTVAVFEGTESLVLKGGLLIYGDEGSARFVTAHEALPSSEKGKPPRLGPGGPIGRDLILDLFKGLDSVPQERFVLPERCLCWEANMLAWWRPAGRRRIFFKAQNDALNALSGHEVMHPPLLFRARDGELAVWALAQDKRPTAETTLCRAPYFNVYDSGLMCTGSVSLPRQLRPDEIDKWEECFFGSNFAHGNAQGVVNHPKSHTGYWTMLSKGNATKTMAMKYLRPLPLTLSGAVKGGERDGR